jgi:hypothetical protein
LFYNAPEGREELRLKPIVYFGQDVVLICDGKCNKAWGRNSRPKHYFSDDPDDYAYVPDQDLGEAPDDPGTYEGNHGKPTMSAHGYLNKWCARECERSEIVKDGEEFELEDFSKPLPNMYSRRK